MNVIKPYILYIGNNFAASNNKTKLNNLKLTNNEQTQFDLTADTPNPFSFTYTAASKALVDERGGMLFVGYGYKLKKVVVLENVGPVENNIWTGDTDINWGSSNIQISADDLANVTVGAKIRIYYQFVDMPEGYHALRITTPWWGDKPEDDVLTQFDLTDDTPNPYEFTYTDTNKALVDERGGMLIVGYGYKVTRVTYE